MNSNDLFVGGVGCGIGLFLLAAAIFNWNWFFDTPKTRWLATSLGRGGARFVLAGLGLLLVALGAAIGAGFRWRIFE